MNKKDLANIRKEFKLQSYLLLVKEIYSVYLKKDNGEIITKEFNHFDMMDVEKRELYLNNFKKVLTGAIDTKIFELDFKIGNEDLDSTQKILYQTINDGNKITECADRIVEKISHNFTYETDIVINFSKIEYYKTDKKRKKEADEAADDYVQSIELILCTINKVDMPKKVLKFDSSEMKFKSNSALDMVINLKSPLDGFMFPSFNSEGVDVNKIVYYSSKCKQVNSIFINEVINCATKTTAIEEKDCFDEILHAVIGERIKSDVMQEIYEKIYEKLEEASDEEPTINKKELKNILNESGIKNVEPMDKAFEQFCGTNYDFKVRNIIPNFNTSSVKIENERVSLTISPKDLSTVKQIENESGKRCLLVELNEDVRVNGFKLEVEQLKFI